MICSRCLYDDTIPGITFDAGGICSYCYLMDELDAQYPTGPAGSNVLAKIAREIRRKRRGKYDVVVGVSGGCDSTYLLYITKTLMGLEPLAVHYDNGWNTDTAESNMANACDALDVDFYRYRVDRDEVRSLARAFMLSGALDFEAPTDIGLTTLLYRAAETFGVKYIFNGHSFRTEGVAPLGWSYMDGRYIASVHEQYGDGVELRTYPNLWLKDFVRWSVRGIRRIRPLYWLDYDKAEAKKMLERRLDWQWYGGHHLENRLTDFFASYLLPRRAGIDMRILGWSALIRSGQMRRSEALKRLEVLPAVNGELLAAIGARLWVSPAEAANAPVRRYTDFDNYKRTFERLRPLFWALVKARRVPRSFYVKYCLAQ
jgi:N-acetyl sugar amidotransferase